MKKNVNDEISRIKDMMGMIEEQKFLDKVKQKIQGAFTKKDSQQPAAPQEKSRNYEELKAEWSKINADTSNMNGFGEGRSVDLNMARTMADMNARTAILKKIGTNKASFGTEIVDEVLFQNTDKSYIKLIVMSPNNIVKK
jgi:hypothetical protein